MLARLSARALTLPLTGQTMYDLLELVAPLDPSKEMMAEGAVLLRGAALAFEADLLAALNRIIATSPFRHMVTPGGYTMSVAMTNCGAAGWVTDRTGYRYDPKDPETGNPWPPMPDCFLDLAVTRRRKPAIQSFAPTHVWSIAISQARACHFTKTRTSAILPIRLYPCRLVCRRRSSSAA